MRLVAAAALIAVAARVCGAGRAELGATPCYPHPRRDPDAGRRPGDHQARTPAVRPVAGRNGQQEPLRAPAPRAAYRREDRRYVAGAGRAWGPDRHASISVAGSIPSSRRRRAATSTRCAAPRATSTSGWRSTTRARSRHFFQESFRRRERHADASRPLRQAP